MSKPFDEPLPKRQIDEAYEFLDQIDAMDELTTEECIILANSLHNLASSFEVAVHSYCVRGYYQDKEAHVHGQLAHYRALSRIERGELDLRELEEKDDGEAAA